MNRDREPNRDTQRFLELLNKQNTMIAARQEKENQNIAPDPFRADREEERREKWGTFNMRNASKRQRPIKD